MSVVELRAQNVVVRKFENRSNTYCIEKVNGVRCNKPIPKGERLCSDCQRKSK